ncbi:hypothetical protein [Aeropyrum camini]|uniref:Uncharacterized protein n=1 Tax=Aeropyrum camini SY1 = JCM 12091 TaxID=1198449 RepID=U3TD73_9CREN|nr:hypothetical protein [Aeropyrum camini]BAN89923.1 hypothetical protein ACAM_0454 [Aeropyrum camini SY1 = JCM 12091]
MPRFEARAYIPLTNEYEEIKFTDEDVLKDVKIGEFLCKITPSYEKGPPRLILVFACEFEDKDLNKFDEKR